jgi:chromosome condensin MukBEF MukE localization factor
MQSASSERLFRHPDVVARRLGDEMVVVNLRTNGIYRLNRTGARLWELLDEPKTQRELEERILAEFDVDRGRVETDLAAALPRLTKLGLATSHGGD